MTTHPTPGVPYPTVQSEVPSPGVVGLIRQGLGLHPISPVGGGPIVVKREEALGLSLGQSRAVGLERP